MDDYVFPTAWYFPYLKEQAWDGMVVPPMHHGNGTIVSFADGHSAWWPWEEQETIEFGRMWMDEIRAPGKVVTTPLPTGPVNEDSYRLQRAIWGRIGYTPTPG
jgi:prepilin-type processing-associated H-X9-DG protein